MDCILSNSGIDLWFTVCLKAVLSSLLHLPPLIGSSAETFEKWCCFCGGVSHKIENNRSRKYIDQLRNRHFDRADATDLCPTLKLCEDLALNDQSLKTSLNLLKKSCKGVLQGMHTTRCSPNPLVPSNNNFDKFPASVFFLLEKFTALEKMAE